MVGHARAEDGTGVVVASSVVNHLDDMKIDKKCMRVVSGDSTNPNTGRGEGALAHMQSMMGRTLQWNVCLLHHGELPLKKLTKFLGIITTSNSTMTGPALDPTWPTIGEELSTDLWSKPVASFEPIDVELQELDEAAIQKLSNDAKYTYRICFAATKG